ncbi:hypothetical protein C8R46DRAFT_385419 [Mycena filopes]|nr:hypothetical protein C8R46DRAFT_385419 [Mycena filopes]
MKARIFCHDSPAFPPPQPTPSSVIPGSHHAPGPDAHHPWAHCEIIPEADGSIHARLASAVVVGLILGVFLSAIPLFFLLRKVKRMRKHGGMHMHAGPGRHGGGPGGRWKFKQPPHHHGFPEYEAEHLLKSEYGHGAPFCKEFLCEWIQNC